MSTTDEREAYQGDEQDFRHKQSLRTDAATTHNVPDVKRPAAWLDENGAVIVNTDYSQGWVRPDGAIPDSWTPLVPAEKAK